MLLKYYFTTVYDDDTSAAAVGVRRRVIKITDFFSITMTVITYRYILYYSEAVYSEAISIKYTRATSC